MEPATAAKHRLYKRYLDAWWPILLQPTPGKGYLRPRVTYVDAFAGPGIYEAGEEGSPVFALDRLLKHQLVKRMNLSRDRVHLIFLEKDRRRHEHLCKVLEDRFGELSCLPVSVHPLHGEAGSATLPALTDLSAWGHPILGVFDSWGSVKVPLNVIQRIAHNRSSEVLVTFGPNWFSRREALNEEHFDAVFGGREFWSPAEREVRPDEKWRVWLNTYRDALRRAGFKYQLQFKVVPRTGLPLYLVYGTNHEKGVEVMKEAMWSVDGEGGLGFEDPRTRGAVPEGQLTLWSGIGMAEPELIELVLQRLDDGPVTLEGLGEWLLLETARWRRQDARRAVTELLKTGSATQESPGRLQRTSVIRRR
ncbi:three-Cys-motif partner protein TcmP [Actinoplanes sp. NPDC023936]|uniref:three-Cys-motif partner protein TcmP n=1 Tax=Actinoplanes sp. NPDC023936 TaxID=3154910 RepID=UPI0033CE2FF9